MLLGAALLMTRYGVVYAIEDYVMSCQRWECLYQDTAIEEIPVDPLSLVSAYIIRSS